MTPPIADSQAKFSLRVDQQDNFDNNSREELLSIEALDQKVEALRQHVMEASKSEQSTVDNALVASTTLAQDPVIEISEELTSLYRSGASVEQLAQVTENALGVIGTIVRDEVARKKYEKKLEELNSIVEAAKASERQNILNAASADTATLEAARAANRAAQDVASLNLAARTSQVNATNSLLNSLQAQQSANISQLDSMRTSQQLKQGLEAMKAVDNVLRQVGNELAARQSEVFRQSQQQITQQTQQLSSQQQAQQQVDASLRTRVTELQASNVVNANQVVDAIKASAANSADAARRGQEALNSSISQIQSAMKDNPVLANNQALQQAVAKMQEASQSLDRTQQVNRAAEVSGTASREAERLNAANARDISGKQEKPEIKLETKQEKPEKPEIGQEKVERPKPEKEKLEKGDKDRPKEKDKVKEGLDITQKEPKKTPVEEQKKQDPIEQKKQKPLEEAPLKKPQDVDTKDILKRYNEGNPSSKPPEEVKGPGKCCPSGGPCSQCDKFAKLAKIEAASPGAKTMTAATPNF